MRNSACVQIQMKLLPVSFHHWHHDEMQSSSSAIVLLESAFASKFEPRVDTSQFGPVLIPNRQSVDSRLDRVDPSSRCRLDTRHSGLSHMITQFGNAPNAYDE
jgi:hypothetical protein